ncbi:MAG: hypothetical protein HDT05_05805 [Bacteroidales bacterium]|nr:hypothetical protein [Bacteroidales bacterium]
MKTIEMACIKSNIFAAGTFLARGVWSCLAVVALFSTAMLASCGGDKDGSGNFPKDFNSKSDEAKVAYMMENASPDSVARFICRAALGEVPGVRIDTLATATLYAYETYKDENLQTFAQAYDSFADALPLDKKMTLRKLAAMDDPMALGYELGLEYVNSIRMDHKNAKTVEAEIASLKKVCAKNPEDSAMFPRFMKGFEVALKIDSGSDVPKEIYNKYAH